MLDQGYFMHLDSDLLFIHVLDFIVIIIMIIIIIAISIIIIIIIIIIITFITQILLNGL